MHVFISYSRDDGSQLATSLHDDLEKEGINTWLDKRDIRDGMNWNTEIDKGLRNARAVAVIVTHGSNLSLQVESEWNEALNNYLPVIPIVTDNTNVPRVLKMLNWINIQESYMGGLSSLIDRLGRLEDDHLEYLNKLLEGYIEARDNADNPGGFDDKIANLTQAIERITMPDKFQEHLKEQTKQAAESLEEERKKIQREAEERQKSHGQKSVGERPLDISAQFRNREAQRAELAQLLTDSNTRIISIIGNGGIGKTAIVSKILADLEDGSWDYPDAPPSFDGIAYLSKNTQGSISLERIFQICGEMLGGEHGKTLSGIWNAKMPIGDKIRQLLNMLREGFYIILFDNMEDFLDESREIENEDLRQFFEMSLRTSNNIRLLVTSRVPLTFPQELMHFDNQILMKDGLPEEHAIKLLRGLDPNGHYGLKDADEELLRKTSQKVLGVPRALEVVASIISNDPLTSLEDLIEEEEIFAQAEFLEKLVRQNYKRMGQEARKLLEALAIFQQSVPMAAIDFMLQEFAPEIQTRSILSWLIQIHMISFDRKSKLLTLHPIDREYIYKVLPEDTRRLMHLRAAVYYDEIGLDEQRWKSLADLETHLARFNHLILGREFVLGLELLNRLDEDYLDNWGDSRRVIDPRLQLIDNLVSLENEAQNRQRLVELYDSIGNPNKGFVLLEKFLPIAKSSGNNSVIANVFYYFGKILINITGDFRERLKYYEQALEYAEQSQDIKIQSKIMCTMSVVYRNLQEYDKSVLIANKALEIADSKQLQVDALASLGRVYRTKDSYEQALEAHKQALVLARELDDPIQIGLRLENVGFDYQVSYQYQEALTIFQEGLDLSQSEIGDSRQQTKFLRALALVTMRLNQISKSLVYRKQRIQIAKDQNRLWQVMYAYSALADYYSVLGNYSEAIKASQEGIRISKQLNYQKDELEFMNEIGQYLSRSGKYDDAQEIFEQTTQLAQNLKVKRAEAEIAVQIGKLYIRQGKYEVAEPIIQSALEVAITTSRLNQVTHRSRYLSEIKLARNEYRESLSLLKGARKNNVIDIKYVIETLIGINYLGLDQVEQANEYLVSAIALAEIYHDRRPYNFSSLYRNGLAQAGLSLISNNDAEKYLADSVLSYNRAKKMCSAQGVIDYEKHLLGLLKPFDRDNKLEPIWNILG